MPFGSDRPVRVARVLAAAAVPASARRGWPLLVADGPAGETVLWVIGVRRAAAAPVTRDSRSVLEVRMSPDPCHPAEGGTHVKPSVFVHLSLMSLLLVPNVSARAQGTPVIPADPKAILETLERGFVSVAERVMPAVVHIDATPKESDRARAAAAARARGATRASA